MQEISSLIKAIQTETRDGFETIIVNGWIGLGVIHCHREKSGVDADTVGKLRALVLLFQTEIGKLMDKYPQLNECLSA